MESIYLLLIGALVAALVTWRLLTGSHHQARHERSARYSLTRDELRNRSAAELARGNYQAMSIQICTSPCRAALNLRGQTFLMNEAPRLPLAECDRTCHCKFVQHSDRRIHADRRYPAADIVGVRVANDDENRTGKDRRRRRMEPYQGIY